MKNLFKTVLIFIAFLVMYSGKANAALISSDFIAEHVKKDVISQISSMMPGKVDVQIGQMPYKSITLPEGKVEINTYLNLKYYNPTTVAKVDVLVNGNEYRTFGVSVKIRIFDNVWVAKDYINRGEVLTASNLGLESRELGFVSGNAARESFVPEGSLVRRTFLPGDIIDLRYIESIPNVIKNNIVSVVFKTSSVSVTVTGEALDNGKIGDYVRVRSKEYKRDYTGRVISENTILVIL